MAGYKIKSGDTLSQIAKKNGMTLKALLGANPGIKNANKIRVGQSIKIPSTSQMPGSKSSNPYAGISKTQMAMMDVKNKSPKSQRAATRSMQTQVKEGGSRTSPNPKKTAETIKKSPHLGLAQKAMDKARERRRNRNKSAKPAKKYQSFSGPSMNEGYMSIGGKVFTGR
jgi:LysM repeat protein